MNPERSLWLMLLVALMSLQSLSALLAASQTPSVDSAPTPASSPRFVLRPVDGQDSGYFTVNATPGSTTELVAELGNAGDEPIELRTFASNTLTLVNGGFRVEDEESEPEGATTWLDYSPETYNFGPEEGIERSFTVTVPEGTAPGQYITGISLQTAEPVEIPGSEMFNQIIRKSIAVFNH